MNERNVVRQPERKTNFASRKPLTYGAGNPCLWMCAFDEERADAIRGVHGILDVHKYNTYSGGFPLCVTIDPRYDAEEVIEAIKQVCESVISD